MRQLRKIGCISLQVLCEYARRLSKDVVYPNCAFVPPYRVV